MLRSPYALSTKMNSLIPSSDAGAFASCTRSRRKPHLSRTRIEPTVVRHDMGVQRPDRQLVHEQGERLGRDAVTPELATDPVAEQLLSVLLPADDVARHLAIRHDRAQDIGVVGADLRPVRGELIPVASGERRHLDRLLIRLVVEERVQVPVLDVPQTHVGAHIVDFRHVGVTPRLSTI